MRIQERCFLLAVVGLCLLGGVAYSLTIVDAETRITTTPGASDEETVVAAQSPQSEPRNDTAESKGAYPTKESDVKATTEAKKKPVVDFKVKSDQKYQKPIAKDDDAKRVSDGDASATPMSTSPMSSTMPDQSPATTKSMDATGVTIPFLFHGEPIVGIVTTTPANSPTVQDPTSSTEEVRVTEETTSSRGRALNISAPEPTNSLHANITDLSDVSMDEDDKEVEGGEYVASHNETSINISSTLLPKVPECVHGNRTYSLGEKVVRDCEEKCVCSENGITDCQPLCVHPYVRAGRGIEDHLCQEKIVSEEPCCAVILCAADSAPEPEETCIFGSQTVARGQRVEDGCSKVCICEAGGHLKCQARCPPNETTSIANQHDRCVQLTDPRDQCCTITLCDVTLGDHEIKAENSTDLSVHLMDVKVLNSTTIKLKLSAKNPQDVTIEISQDNRVWSRQKPDKDGVISTLEPAHTYHVRVVEGARTGPSIQVSLPAEVVKVTNITEKMSDKNSCYYRGKSYKIDAEWYDECLHFCTCTEGGKPECVSIECPTDFGLDLLDSTCLDWETVPPDFKPQPPNCCPQEVRCRNNGSCLYEDIVYDNWSKLPMNVTGCEHECYCEFGNVSCRAVCSAVPALPPPNLCPYQATLASHPDNPCCVQWTCVPPPATGMNVTTAYPGPLATDTFDRQTIDNSKRPNNKSETFKPSQEPERGASSFWGDSKTYKTQPDATTHEHPHYPMDPGHPTAPYNGPYSPDYVPTHPTVENVFHLPTHSEKPISTPKEKSKSKSDNKKPVEPVKPHKDMIDQYFPGPLAPNRFPDKTTSTSPYSVNENQYISGLSNPNKLPPQQKDVLINHPPLISLNPHPDMLGPHFPYVSNNNKENVSPAGFNDQFDNLARPPYRGPIPVKPDTIDPNVIVSSVPKKKAMPSNPFVDTDKTKTSPVLPGRPKQGQRNPDQEILPEQLYHLINLHSGLTQLDQAPPQGHLGLYDLHQQISGQKQPPNDRGPSDYFGTQSSGPKKVIKPHISAQKNENGQTTYHIHTPDIPTSPQQLEELLAHISQHDPNPGPFQHYPGQPAIPHNVPNGPPTPPILPLHIDAHIPHSGLTHLNHPFAAQTPNQSGLDHNIVPPGFPLPGSISGFPAAPPSNEVTVQILEALDEHTVRLVFTVPQVLVGLHGRVELRYTSDKTNFDPSTWKLQVFAPPNDLIATQQLEFELGGLEPITEYKVKITVRLKDLNNSPSSKIYNVRTLEKRTDEATLPPQIPIDAELRAMEMNSSWVNIMWKKFTQYELQFIDGVQLRYKEHDGKVYAATPLIHRSVTNYVIENLKPATKYEVGIYFIPFAEQTTELISEKTIEITTYMEPDPYSFDVKVEIKTIKSTDVEVTWSGVPYPEDKYVNIYRAIYQSDTGKEDTSTFKIAKRDSHAKTVISDLKPGTRYRLWLEIYLTNGRIKKSNVQDFVTKPGVLLPATVSQQAGKLASLPLHEGDYYGPLVIVAIVASLAILSTLILLMMLMKRRSSSKADISPRKTTSAYDNPSYKTCEDAVTISNGRNKTMTDHEMTTINSNAKETA